VREFPTAIRIRHADGARSVTGGDCGRLVGKEDPVSGVETLGNPPQRTRAIKTAVAFQPAVPAQRTWQVAKVRSAIRAEKNVGFPAACRRFFHSHVGRLRYDSPNKASLAKPKPFQFATLFLPTTTLRIAIIVPRLASIAFADTHASHPTAQNSVAGAVGA
jgi:hypothetical protein